MEDLLKPYNPEPEEPRHVPVKLGLVGLLLAAPLGRPKILIGLAEVKHDGEEGRRHLYSMEPADAGDMADRILDRLERSPGLTGGN